MATTYLFVAIVLFIGATEVNGAEEPALNITSRMAKLVNAKGRLITPAEGCGFSDVKKNRIVGGVPAKVGAWPWIALLGYNIFDNVEFHCGGSLITSKHVLTAAHCILPDLEFARLGEHDIRTEDDGPHQDVKVVHTESHGNYIRRQGLNDIGILYLERDVDFTDRIRPVCVPVHAPIRFKSFIHATPFVAGWGYLREEAREISPILQQIQVPIHENHVCLQQFKKEHVLRFQKLSEEVLCAGYLSGGKDSCQADSGGPMMLPVFDSGDFPFYQIGIVSYGFGCARPNLPAVYANVPHYADWIIEKIELQYSEETLE